MDGEYVTNLESVLTAVDLIHAVKNSNACKEAFFKDTQNLVSVEFADLRHKRDCSKTTQSQMG